MVEVHTIKKIIMEENKNIETNGGYQNEDVVWHQHSNLLMLKMLELWPDKNIPIIDLGCGHNWYASVLNHLGYKAIGVDGVLLKGVDYCMDITKTHLTKLQSEKTAYSFREYLIQILPNDLRDKINIISLEVGEHIPTELSEGYFKNLTSFGGDIIISWAIPGQAGIGHINCQPNEWVQIEMFKRGYLFNHSYTLELREAVKNCHCNWFKNTIMYFKPRNK